MHVLTALSTLLFLTRTTPAASNTNTNRKHLTISAVLNDEAGIARIECWQLQDRFMTYPTVGKSTYLGDISNATYVVLPPRSEEGYHKPPHPMFFVLLSGLARVVAPEAKQELWIVEGVNPLIVAVDTYGRGHLMFYSSDKETVALQIPFEDGVEPKHTVLHEGACSSTADVAFGGDGEVGGGIDRDGRVIGSSEQSLVLGELRQNWGGGSITSS